MAVGIRNLIPQLAADKNLAGGNDAVFSTHLKFEDDTGHEPVGKEIYPMTDNLPPLPYPFDALEPYIDAKTMEIHHDKHHGAYDNNLNKALEAIQNFKNAGRRTARTDAGSGGHSHGRAQQRRRTLNHSMFWSIMTKGGGGEPMGDLATRLTPRSATPGISRKNSPRLLQRDSVRVGPGW